MTTSTLGEMNVVHEVVGVMAIKLKNLVNRGTEKKNQTMRASLMECHKAGEVRLQGRIYISNSHP